MAMNFVDFTIVTFRPERPRLVFAKFRKLHSAKAIMQWPRRTTCCSQQDHCMARRRMTWFDRWRITRVIRTLQPS